MVLIALLACAATLQGVVVEPGPVPVVQDLDGRQWSLELDEQSAPVGHLLGCTVRIEGTRRPRGVQVQEWEVLAAWDGSTPFVGVLARDGDRLVLRDPGTGLALRLEQDTSAPLEPFVGLHVLVVGVAIGDHELRVMGFRVLADPDPER